MLLIQGHVSYLRDVEPPGYHDQATGRRNFTMFAIVRCSWIFKGLGFRVDPA